MKISDGTLLSRLARTIREHNLIQSNDTLIVALSGGADSAALLDLLAKLPGFNLRLVAAHLNHCLRGVEADADEEFCRKLAADYGIPFDVLQVDVKALAYSEGLNLEDAGRRARINFLDQIRDKYCAAAVATAHHSDDQAETVLMRLLRGSGMTGLAGMPYRNQRGYIRPLLDVSRAEIEQYLSDRGLGWREDASNRDTTFLRNRIRHELLPLLEQYNPAIRKCLTSTAAILSDENTLLESLANEAFESSWRKDGCTFSCSTAELKAYPAALQRRILRYVCKQLAGNLDGFSQNHVESIRQLLDSPHPNSSVSLPQGISAVREYDRILLLFKAEQPFSVADDVVIIAPGYYPLPDGGLLEITICSTPVEVTGQPVASASFDIEKTPFPWRVRTFRPGDRIVPFGMSGRKKVKDVFIDKKIPLPERSRIPLIFCGDNLIWIAGVCVSELCRINNPSEVTFQVKWQR